MLPPTALQFSPDPGNNLKTCMLSPYARAKTLTFRGFEQIPQRNFCQGGCATGKGWEVLSGPAPLSTPFGYDGFDSIQLSATDTVPSRCVTDTN